MFDTVNLSEILRTRFKKSFSYVNDAGEMEWSCNYKVGAEIDEIGFIDVLKYCERIPIESGKHRNGCIWAYDSDVLGCSIGDQKLSNRILFLDIDGVSKEVCDTLYNGFEELCKYVNSLLSIQYSSGYYLKNPSHGAGLHLYVAIDKISIDEYKQTAINVQRLLVKIIKKKFGFDVEFDQGLNALGQRLYLFHSPYKLNDHFSFCSLDWLRMVDGKVHFGFFESDTTEKRESVNITNSTLNINREEVNNTKLCLDYKTRFVVFQTLKECGVDIDMAKQMIQTVLYDAHMPNDSARRSPMSDWLTQLDNVYRGKSKLSTLRGFEILKSLGFTFKEQDSCEDEIDLGKDGWISEHCDEIIKMFNKYEKLLVVAPTGSGKTVIINDKLAKELNAVVIVPYNKTNSLYSNLQCINSDNHNPIPDDEACVLVLDQAEMHWEKIKNRNLIIDESHLLFTSCDFRDRVCRLMVNINRDNARVICFTATPEGEVDFLNLHVMRFVKDRSIIDMSVSKSNSVEWDIYNTIKKHMGRFDRVVVFDDRGNMKLKETILSTGLVKENELAVIRRSTADTEDSKLLSEKQLLLKKIYLLTNIGFQGLNFKNENESVLVLGRIEKGETLYSDIIQCIGRVRKSRVVAKFFYHDSGESTGEMSTVDEKHRYANILHEWALENGLSDLIFSYSERLLDDCIYQTNVLLENYSNKFATWDMIKRIIQTNYKYVNVIDETYNECGDHIAMSLVQKRADSIDYKQFILKNKSFDMESKSNYIKQWNEDFNRLVNESGLDRDFLFDFVKKCPKENLVSTILDKLNLIWRVVRMDDESWNNTINHFDELKRLLKNDKLYIKRINSEMKKNIEIREKYKSCMAHGVIQRDILMDSILDALDQENEKTKQSRSNGGSKGGLKGHKVVIDGVEYNSIKEASQILGMSVNKIYRKMQKK